MGLGDLWAVVPRGRCADAYGITETSARSRLKAPVCLAVRGFTAYETRVAYVFLPIMKKICPQERLLVLEDDTKIKMEDILKLSFDQIF